MSELRKYVRIPEYSQIFYEIIPILSGKAKDGATKDISQGGIRFLTQEFIPKDSHLRIKLTLNKTLFNFEALVKFVWIKQLRYSEIYEVGVEFIDMPPKALEYLINYIKACLDTKKE